MRPRGNEMQLGTKGERTAKGQARKVGPKRNLKTNLGNSISERGGDRREKAGRGRQSPGKGGARFRPFGGKVQRSGKTGELLKQHQLSVVQGAKLPHDDMGMGELLGLGDVESQGQLTVLGLLKSKNHLRQILKGGTSAQGSRARAVERL